MKTNLFKTSSVITIPSGLLVGLLAGYLLFSPEREETAEQGSKTTDPETWTCSMHPQVQLPEPGACPICGMDLIRLESMGQNNQATQLSLSESARTLAAIQTTPARKGTAAKEIRLFGKVSYDETRLRTITARFPARIEKLYVNATGIPVKKGDHLASVYSKDLLAAQTDLITALKFGNRQDATAGPKEQLRQWGFSEAHIQEIEDSLVTHEFLEIDAPIGGTVVAKSIQEGDHVALGANFITIADLTHVWITFDAYESDLPWIHYGQEIEIFPEGNPGQKIVGKVSLIYPEIDSMSRTAKIRVSIPNPDLVLRPGQFVRGILSAQLSETGEIVVPNLSGMWVSPMHPEIVKDHPGNCDVCGMQLVPANEMGLAPTKLQSNPLLVPSSAVLRTGKRAVVYVEEENVNGPIYVGREVQLGVRAGDQFVVLNGLKEGEKVVTQGAFKIDSALQIQAKPSMMGTGRETGPFDELPPSPRRAMARPSRTGDEGRGDQDQASIDFTDIEPIELDPTLAAKLIPTYLALQEALAQDKLESAKSAIKDMMEITGHQSPIDPALHSMGDAQNLDDLRRPHFEILSNSLIQAAKETPSAFSTPLYQVNCFMAYPDRGADWLQSSELPQNPYLGTYMQNCGVIKGAWGVGQARSTSSGQGTKGEDK